MLLFSLFLHKIFKLCPPTVLAIRIWLFFFINQWLFKPKARLTVALPSISYFRKLWKTAGWKKEKISTDDDNFNRKNLVSVLEKQYANLNVSDLTNVNIKSLSSPKTFTITTGHQLNLFTGPLYFLYKIVSTINLTKQLKGEYPDYNFVPVYWMATEDHDFEEINYFNLHGKKVRWNPENGASGGRLLTKGFRWSFWRFSFGIRFGKKCWSILGNCSKKLT